jgi:teichuronic acid biosynthesis glycosyltransferase TuaG
MKFSIITTFFNSSEHISDCLISVQTISSNYQIEHILVNDGSTDDTLQIINNAKLQNIKIVGKKHIGRGHALNLGLANASGDYISILDSDDCINPSWIEFFLDNVSRHQDADVYLGTIATDLHTFQSYKNPRTTSKKIINPTKILFFNPICHSGSIFRNSVVQKIGGYSTSIKSQFDWDLWLRLALEDVRFISFNRLAAFKRIHSNQSFESKQHFLYTVRGVALQLNVVLSRRPIYFFPVLIFAFARIAWSLFPRKLRTSRLFDMLR